MIDRTKAEAHIAHLRAIAAMHRRNGRPSVGAQVDRSAQALRDELDGKPTPFRLPTRCR
jgi:hypothetical protein